VVGRGCEWPERVEIDLVVASDLQVLDPTAAGQEVVSNVEDVVALEVGLMAFEEVKVPVNVLDEADLRARRWIAPMPPGEMARTGRRSRNGCWRRRASAGGVRRGLIFDAAEDSPLASVQWRWTLAFTRSLRVANG